ncbi:MAG TPA: hypothetical protein VIM07_17605 [Chitinophagaceae bacterium]
MSLAEKKEALMHIVKEADEKLTALLFALADEYNSPDYEYSEEELNLFNERKEEFYRNNKQGYSVEEAHELVRRKYNDGL